MQWLPDGEPLNQRLMKGKYWCLLRWNLLFQE